MPKIKINSPISELAPSAGSWKPIASAMALTAFAASLGMNVSKPSGNFASSVVVVPAPPPPGFSGSGAGSCMSLHCSLVTSPGLAVK